MTLANLQNSVPYGGDGVTVAFPIPFPFEVNAHIKVYLVVDSTGIETLQSNYSLTGAGGLTGTCTMDVAPAIGETLYIRRVLPLTQETDYQDNDAFDAQTSEVSLDRLAQMIQQLATNQQRSLNKEGQTGDNYNAGNGRIVDAGDAVDMQDLVTLAQVSALVNAAVALISTLSPAVVTAYSTTLLAATTAANWRTLLGLGPLATSSAAGTTAEVIRGDGTASQTLTGNMNWDKSQASAGTVTESLSAYSNNTGAGPAQVYIVAKEKKTNKQFYISVGSAFGIDLIASEAFNISLDSGTTDHFELYSGGMRVKALEVGYREIGWVTKNTSFTIDLATDLTATPNLGLRKTDANPYNYTIPLNATDAFPIGYVLPIANIGTAGSVSIVPTGGVTLRLAGSTSASATRVFAAGALGGIIKVGADDWIAYGSGVS